MKTKVITVVAVVMLAAGCLPGATDSSKAETPPIIDSFGAQTVAPSSATYELHWSVSDAATVRIDNRIGDVAPTGTRLVTPATSTQYTLTAANKAGSVKATVYIVVPEERKPDLIIRSIRQRESRDGYVIVYTIQNRGATHAGPSTTELYVDGKYKDKDSMDSIAAGASVTRQFTGWVASLATKKVVGVIADAGNSVDESDEGNNKMQVAIETVTVFDFVKRANLANWKTGPPPMHLFFGGAVDNTDGCVRYRGDRKLEDGTGPQTVLFTRPKWVENGWIEGDFYEMYSGMYGRHYTVQKGDHFFARVGFLEDASDGDVTFRVIIRPAEAGGDATSVAAIFKAYGSPIETIDVPLDPWIGRNVGFVLRVETNGPPKQDWAAWVEARIVRFPEQ